MTRTHEVAARIACQCADLSRAAEQAGLKLLVTLLDMAVVEARRQQFPSVICPFPDGKDSK